MTGQMLMFLGALALFTSIYSFFHHERLLMRHLQAYHLDENYDIAKKAIELRLKVLSLVIFLAAVFFLWKGYSIL